MAKVVINRSAGALPVVRRDEAKPGSIFVLAKRNGTKGTKKYGSLGNNGKLYSVNLANGELASSPNPGKTVALIGKFAIKRTDWNPADHKKTTRGEVASGQLFRSATKETVYLALGTLKDGRSASVNMANPFNENYAVSDNKANPVVVIGEAEFVATVSD